MAEIATTSFVALLPSPEVSPRRQPKRFVGNQIPDRLLKDAALNAAIAALPSNYNFEVHKCLWRILSSGCRRVALQLPDGLLLFSFVLVDIFTSFGNVDHCFILGDATYGACCVDDLTAAALSADLLIHYGHSCLVPLDVTSIPCLYVFVHIKIDVHLLVQTVKFNLSSEFQTLILAGTIQFASSIRSAKVDLEQAGFKVIVPHVKPLSPGEVLGCTSPVVSANSGDVLVFVADGRFHLEAFMIANPGVRAFRYDPYVGKLILEEYDDGGMKESRKKAVIRAREAAHWGVLMGTLGRQGNPRVVDRLEKKIKEKGMSCMTVLMSEITPEKIALFEDSVDAWVQIACPRLSIDWGDAFGKPLLNSFEAEIALEIIPGWWEKSQISRRENPNCGAENGQCCVKKMNGESGGDYAMDYYAQEGGDWNACYMKKQKKKEEVFFQD